jgi:hypothetical protein
VSSENKKKCADEKGAEAHGDDQAKDYYKNK